MRAGLAAVALVVVTLSMPSAYAAQEPDPTDRELAESVRRLEPVVRRLEPVVRSLRTDSQEGDQTIVTISSDVLFEFDSADLTPEAARTIAALAEEIAATQGGISVVGHTDAIGTDEYNQGLSERRARAVADYLERAGVAPERLVVGGAGEARPIAPNETEAGRAENRRVEIAVL